MSRKTVYTAVFAALASGSMGAALSLAGSSASANYPAVCLGVSTTGTLSGNHQVGPVCAGSVPANQCVSPTVFAPGAAVNVYACLPN